MRNNISVRFISIVIAIILGIGGVNAQTHDYNYSVALDTNVIVIGDQINLTFKAKIPKGTNIEFPVLKDTVVKGLEIINIGKLNTVKLKDGNIEKYIEYKVTAFDTGVYKIPSYPIKIKKKGHDNIVRTEEIYLGVTTFKIDTKKGFADIVQPKDTPVNFAEVMPYLLWVLLAGGLIALIIFIYRKWKRKESIFHKPEKPKEPAHIVAYRELDRIKKEKLWEKGYIKSFYTDVTGALRVYVEDQFGIQAMEQTSIEIVESIKGEEFFDDASVVMLEDILFRADFVKFAKALPLGNENQESIDNAYKIISKTYKAVVDRAAEVAEFENEEE